MILTQISLWSQAIAAGFFLMLFLSKVEWWKDTMMQVLTGLVFCLFALTLYLAITATNEGLGNSPALITVSRFGFAAVLIYGIARLSER